jgi:antirestriction protein ArdC
VAIMPYRPGDTGKVKQHSKMKTQNADCYEIITDRIISLLEQGTIPWCKPWNTTGGMPKNVVSGKHYRGMNTFLLHAMNYESPHWLTFKQALELGGNVRKGEKSCPIIFWKRWEKEDKATGEKSVIPMMRFYHVFNVAQCDNLVGLFGEPVAGSIPEPLAPSGDYSKAEALITGYKNAPVIKHGMTRAYYSPGGDYVGLPDNAKFTSPAHYYATLFHELAHSTGHASRLARAGIAEGHDGFGNTVYSKEELVAEMGSAFLCGLAGIDSSGEVIENSAAYIANWLQVLRGDKKLVVQAAGQAQRAIDHICGVNHAPSSATAPKESEPVETDNDLIPA